MYVYDVARESRVWRGEGGKFVLWRPVFFRSSPSEIMPPLYNTQVSCTALKIQPMRASQRQSTITIRAYAKRDPLNYRDLEELTSTRSSIECIGQ